MAKTAKHRTMFVINVQEEEGKCTESQLDILLKIHEGQYRLVKKYKRSSVWNVYREIARPDGSKLKWRYYCTGCKRVMQSTGGTTSNLRIHKCHVRYLKQHARDHGQQQQQRQRVQQQPQRSQINIQRLPITTTTNKRRISTYEDEIFHVKTDQYSDVEPEEEEEDYEDVHSSTVAPAEESIEQLDSPSERPLLKLFSEDDSWSPEITEVQPIDMVQVAEEHSQHFSKETIKPNSTLSIQIDATAISEAESYGRAWAHAFLKLSEDQKVYAKRSIDELLILGRLERLNISTVTSLTTNL